MANPDKPFVVYWNTIPSPYTVERFNALVARGNLDFEAWFNDRIASDRSWDVDESVWSFKYRYVPNTVLFGHKVHWPVYILGRRPDVLVSWYAEPAYLIGWCIARLRGVKTCFRVLKTYDSWVRRHPIKETLKRFLFRRVDGIETVGKDGQCFAMRYGASSDRIFFATHTVDIGHYQFGCLAAKKDREHLRRNLELKGVVYIYVGRLWLGKGLKFLLEAFELVQKSIDEEISLLLVGDGQDEQELRRICYARHIHNVVFAGFKQKPELPLYYAISDVFVFPTLGDPYGVVVDEAMACSLPIISTSAAGEIGDRVQDKVNGFIVPPQDSRTLADRMIALAENASLREKMGRVSARRIVNHTPEQWAEDFELMIEKVLSRSQE